MAQKLDIRELHSGNHVSVPPPPSGGLTDIEGPCRGSKVSALYIGDKLLMKERQCKTQMFKSLHPHY